MLGDAKPEAGVREIKLLPILRDELDSYKLARQTSGPNALVFTTATGQPRDDRRGPGLRDELARPHRSSLHCASTPTRCRDEGANERLKPS